MKFEVNISTISLSSESSITAHHNIKEKNKGMVKFCPECAHPIANSSLSFCPNCGARLPTTSSEAQPIPALQSTVQQQKYESGAEKVKTGGKPLTVEFILGLIGGIIGFLAGGVAIIVGSLGSAFALSGASDVIGLGVGAIIFSIIGIIGAAIVKSKTKIAGYLMIISAIGGLICISAFYILSFILLIIAGIMAVRYKE